MNISLYFNREEFERDGDVIPLEAIPCFQDFCKEVLDPLRGAFGEPFYVTSGYRSEMVNTRIGGAPDSQHIATATHCAADGYFASYRKNMRPIFDWLRENNVPYDECILEHGKMGDIIHLSYSRNPRRVALEGQTFNQSGYISWPVSA